MSKIEQALRKARNDKSANDQDDHLEDHNQGAANQDKKRRPGRGRSLPALVQLEPCAHYDLEDDVLASNSERGISGSGVGFLQDAADPGAAEDENQSMADIGNHVAT